MQERPAGDHACGVSGLRAWGGRRLRAVQVGPRGRYQRAGSIGKYQRQMQFAAAMAPAQYVKRQPRKGMARTRDGYLIGIAIEMVAVVVGSL